MNSLSQCRKEARKILPILAKPSDIFRVDTLSEMMRSAREINCPPLVINIPNLQHEDLARLCLLLGRGISDPRAFGKVRDIRFTGDPSSIAESFGAHPLHTDGTFETNPPSFFLLYVIETDSAFGGENLLVPLEPILASLAHTHLQKLLESPVRFARRDKDGIVDEWAGALLSYSSTCGLSCRWRYDDHVRPEAVDSYDTGLINAIDAMHKAIESIPPIRYFAERNDLLLIPNKHYLHGRTALSPDSKRHILRAWIA
jgi:hypothetical protein